MTLTCRGQDLGLPMVLGSSTGDAASPPGSAAQPWPVQAWALLTVGPASPLSWREGKGGTRWDLRLPSCTGLCCSSGSAPLVRTVLPCRAWPGPSQGRLPSSLCFSSSQAAWEVKPLSSPLATSLSPAPPSALPLPPAPPALPLPPAPRALPALSQAELSQEPRQTSMRVTPLGSRVQGPCQIPWVLEEVIMGQPSAQMTPRRSQPVFLLPQNSTTPQNPGGPSSPRADALPPDPQPLSQSARGCPSCHSLSRSSPRPRGHRAGADGVLAHGAGWGDQYRLALETSGSF